MNELDVSAFRALFKHAYEKCFGHPVVEPLSETASKAFSNKIFDQTGLVIGSRSIKNYSFFVLDVPDAKTENPSIATLDTLARYVQNAPYTDEVQRKEKENHYPYWFEFKETFHRLQQPPARPSKPARKKWLVPLSGIAVIAIIFIVVLVTRFAGNTYKPFMEDFFSVGEDTLWKHGWFIQSIDEAYWKKRHQHAGQLTLFTLRGDNWPDSLNQPAIKNLLVRNIAEDCFTAEVHLSAFIPQQNWQQAGILLLEDTAFTGKSLRASLVYNDFYGGFPSSNDIVLQVVTSAGKAIEKPEEIAHQLVFKLDSTNQTLVKQNLQYVALRIEKQDKRLRLLFANGAMANSAFKEIINRDIDIQPRYLALFAMKGFVDSAAIIPARFDFFLYHPLLCEP